MFNNLYLTDKYGRIIKKDSVVESDFGEFYWVITDRDFGLSLKHTTSGTIEKLVDEICRYLEVFIVDDIYTLTQKGEEYVGFYC